ncbi:MAG TPA: tetratricopeptide repeat protein [Longimicrobiales bacterium]|nr:tetratricopeptide repeat protein [Longimicrobiales bacterium]
MRTIIVLGSMVLAASFVTVPAARQCPEPADAFTATGWQDYRAGRMDAAGRAFAAAQARCPEHMESRVGLGYVELQRNALDEAGRLFRSVLAMEGEHVDALVGLGLVEWRAGRGEEARARFEHVLRLDSGRDDVRRHLAALPETMGPPPERAPLVRPDTLEYPARTSGDRFEIRTPAGWQTFHINGVNIGAALPGRFPSQFPGATTYREWIEGIAEMGANTIRVYTVHPPAFYDALAAHNRAHPDRPLWLLHGVWAELPPGDDYHDAVWKGEFFAAMEQVIDLLHGRADIMPRPGHAAGYYTADVSRWTLGLILGREWEPYSVAEFNEANPTLTGWQGRFFRVSDTTPMDAWLAEAMDHAVAYETDTYGTQRPVAYTNWPTLDPMRHPVEIDAVEELAIRGIPFEGRERAHNEDEVALGEVPVTTTAAFPAGYFAAFHVYPYFPDFLLHDPAYGAAESPWGRSSYFGYLQDLKRHFPDVPLVIAEFGLPVSWGVAHFNPQGWHHGGHTEAAQAEINARMAREIAAAGMAGAIVFAWIDEWFKHTWLDQLQELPAERNRMWWNRMNPEQHYGVNAVEPVRRLGETLAARQAAWDTVAPLYAGDDGSRIRAHADEAFLWLHVSGPAARADRLVVGFDILDPATGGMRLPGDGPRLPVGVEYILEVDATQARVRAAPGIYPVVTLNVPAGATKRDVVSPVADRPAGFFAGLHAHDLRPPTRPTAIPDGRYEALLTVVNRARVGADSTSYLGMGYDRGVLRPGPLPDGAWERVPGTGALEVRLPWTLIGVTDPSSRHVASSGTAGATQVDAIRIVAGTQDARGAWRLWPASGRPADVAAFTWATWDEPRFQARRRPVFDAMRRVFAELEQTSGPRQAANRAENR